MALFRGNVKSEYSDYIYATLVINYCDINDLSGPLQFKQINDDGKLEKILLTNYNKLRKEIGLPYDPEKTNLISDNIMMKLNKVFYQSTGGRKE